MTLTEAFHCSYQTPFWQRPVLVAFLSPSDSPVKKNTHIGFNSFCLHLLLEESYKWGVSPGSEWFASHRWGAESQNASGNHPTVQVVIVVSIITVTVETSTQKLERCSYVIDGFADYRFGFVFEVGPLTPVKRHGPSCLWEQKTCYFLHLSNLDTSEEKRRRSRVYITHLYKRSLCSLIQNNLLSLHKVSSVAFRVDACGADSRAENIHDPFLQLLPQWKPPQWKQCYGCQLTFICIIHESVD